MRTEDFSSWLRDLLRPDLFKDYCPNGLCVEGSSQVNRVLTGVSFRMDLVQEAIRQKADAIVVHHPHGFWNNEPRLPIGTLGAKVALLMRHGISLYGFHLPLDGHPEIGNNALIAKGLGLEVERGFMKEGMEFVGNIALSREPMSYAELERRYEGLLGKPLLHRLPCGPEAITRVAICSGSGASGIAEALSLGAQALVTGEIKENTPIVAQEEGLHVLAGGHHRSEVFGVRALSSLIEARLGLPAAFFDCDHTV